MCMCMYNLCVFVIEHIERRLQTKALVLLSVIATIEALPIANVHVKFISRPHVYEHGITTDGDRTIYQKSFVSIGRRSISSNPQRQFGERINIDPNLQQQNFPEIGKYATIIKPENAESLWPVGVFLPPIDGNDLGHGSQQSRHMTPDYSNGLEYHDPLLLIGPEAMMAVKYLYGRGELFYDDFPHVRAILRNQEERRLNGLHGHILNSLRPSSPFYKRHQG
ncbi:PREDICTED: uncharacterized protein LOC107064511 isoform X2 [Polistes dominula]|uniref:Uncharacterized protein LOC107064511 isoform X2 n=1 Tax=Polistes dominula TaxID=743375 RepID=A0ABM1HXQ5_POLDO|nr:PREDICTED: uncharacterized protein LOC107064511 isoform X2 [Polistes dominula]